MPAAFISSSTSTIRSLIGLAIVCLFISHTQRLGDGVMTVGIPIGFGVIVFTIVITAIYVKRANGEFDDLNDAVSKAVLK